MNVFKKVLITAVAVCLLLTVAASLAGALQDALFPEQPQEAAPMLEAYPRAIERETQPPETLPPETEPPQTLPPETLPPETLPPETEPVRQGYDQVPQFYMTDYPHIRYRTTNMAISGSNITSLAMVASYLTGQEYTPEELMDYFATFIGNSIQWLDYASEQLQLPFRRAGNFHDTRQALEEGKLAIAVVGKGSLFTQDQYFIVMTGINEAGLITVLDPNETHYTQWNLQEGLANGFTDGNLIAGYQGAWIYDPEQMGEDPFVYEPEENTDPFRYEGVELTDQEIDMMVRLIYMEAQSEPFEGQQAIAEVILNRLAADNFPGSIYNIIHAPEQFTSSDRLYLAEPTHTQYEAVERALNGPYVLPMDVVFFSNFKVNENVWGTIGNHTFCHQW